MHGNKTAGCIIGTLKSRDGFQETTTVMVHMGKVLVLGQAFPPGNGKWVTWQLVCVPVWAELLPAARGPRVATYTRTAARSLSWASDASRLSVVLPMCARAARGCLFLSWEGAQRGAVTEERGQGHPAGQDPTCWDSQAIRSRWAVCLLQSCIPSAAPAGQLCKIQVPTCPGILDKVLGVTSHWWVTTETLHWGPAQEGMLGPAQQCLCCHKSAWHQCKEHSR